VKKHGQPDSPKELTAGRRTLLIVLNLGTADGDQMAAAANWLRDLYGSLATSLHNVALYRELYERRATSLDAQRATAAWIENLINGEPPVSEDIAEGQRANLRQVGGSHYAKPIQHWDFVGGHDYGYLIGQTSKYLFRWRDKNGLEDLQKAQHFLEKTLEMEGQHEDEGFVAPSIGEFLDANNIPEAERVVFILLHAFHETRNPAYLGEALGRMRALVAAAT
jgi:hypothetical protein